MKVAIIGAGRMTKEYIKAILYAYPNCTIEVFGNSSQNCENISNEFKVKVSSGGFEQYIDVLNTHTHLILATPVDKIESHLILLDKALNSKIKILAEKPAILNISSIGKLTYPDRIFVAYNRRFLPSALYTKELINNNGIISCSFDFTEWSSRVLAAQSSKFILANWLEANSSHILDLVFFLIGYPKELKAYTSGHYSWHNPVGFTGSGKTEKDTPFVFNSDWRSAGRWSIEIKYDGGSWHLSPIETLQSQIRECLTKETIEIPEKYQEPKSLKPGLFNMIQAFFDSNQLNKHLATIENQKNLLQVCTMLRNGS